MVDSENFGLVFLWNLVISDAKVQIVYNFSLSYLADIHL